MTTKTNSFKVTLTYTNDNGKQVVEPIFASRKHCFFATLNQAKNKLMGIRRDRDSIGRVIDRASGEIVLTCAC